jgi:proteasome activator subunit 4
MFEDELLKTVLPVIEPLLVDTDRFKQRAGAEILTGLIRGTCFTRAPRASLTVLP